MKSEIAVLAMLVCSQALLENGTAHAADVEAGKALFKKCAACHSVIDDAGDVLVKGGKVGPNLYEVIGRQVAVIDDFKYSTSLAQLGETGFIWDEAQLAKWVIDPKKYLRKALDDNKAKSKMVFKLKEGGADIAAFLASISQK